MTAASDIELGSAIIELTQPHAGHERAFHRWIERDQLYTIGASAPGTLAASLWLAPRELRQLRRPRPENAITGNSDRGTHLSTCWIQRGMLDEHQPWVTARLQQQREAGTLFPHRDQLDTHRYDVRACVRRDADGVPPELALHRGYPGIVATWIGAVAGQTLGELDSALSEGALPRFLAHTPIELSIVLEPLSGSADGPPGTTAPPGLGERLLVLHFVSAAPDELWQATFTGLEETLIGAGAGELLMAAPFVANVPGAEPPAWH